jgi:hypothetical protein
MQIFLESKCHIRGVRAIETALENYNQDMRYLNTGVVSIACFPLSLHHLF